MKKLTYLFFVLSVSFLLSCKMGQDKFFNSHDAEKSLVHFSASVPAVNQNAKSVNSQSGTCETYSSLNAEGKLKYILTGSATINGKTQTITENLSSLNEVNSIALPLEAGSWSFELKAVLAENPSKVVLQATKNIEISTYTSDINFALKEVAGKGSVNLTIKVPLSVKDYSFAYQLNKMEFSSTGIKKSIKIIDVLKNGEVEPADSGYYELEFNKEIDSGIYSFDLSITELSREFKEFSIIFEVHNSLVTTVVSTNNDINQQYSVTYSLDGSAGEEFLQSPVRSLNSSMTYTLPTRSTVQKPGFTFKGWQKDGTDISVLQNVQENITLTPVWEPNTKVYVSSSGDDLNPGTSDSPVKTMKRAIYLLNKDESGTANGIYIKDTYTVSDADKDGWSLDGYSSQTIWRDDSLTSGSVINIPAGKTLTADHITFHGNSPFDTTTGTLYPNITATNQEYLSVSGIAILSNINIAFCYNNTVSGESSPTSGAAIRTYGEASLILSHFTIQNAYAKTGSAAIYTETTSSNRPVIQVKDGKILNCYNNTSSSNATAVTVNTSQGKSNSFDPGFNTRSYIKDVEFSGNSCIANGSSGGAVKVVSTCYFSFDNCKFSDNTCKLNDGTVVKKDLDYSSGTVYLSGNPTDVYVYSDFGTPLNVSNLTGTGKIKLTLPVATTLPATPLRLVSGSTDTSLFELTNSGYHLEEVTTGSEQGIYMVSDPQGSDPHPYNPGLSFDEENYKIKMTGDCKADNQLSFKLYKDTDSTLVDVSASVTAWNFKFISGSVEVPVVKSANTFMIPSDVFAGDSFVIVVEAQIQDYTVHGSFPIVIVE